MPALTTKSQLQRQLDEKAIYKGIFPSNSNDYEETFEADSRCEG